MRFDIFRKHGRTWTIATTVTAADSRTAARQYHRFHHVKRVGVRPADTIVRLFVYNFTNRITNATDLH